MRGRHLSIAVVGCAAALTFGALRGGAVGAAEEEPGRAAFVANKCNLCHAVSSAGIEATAKSEKMKGPDLEGKVAEHGVDWARKFLRREVQKDGKQHSKEYKGTPEDLERILAWLETQK